MLEDNVDQKYYLSDNMIQYLEYGKYKAAKVSNKLKQTDTGICPTLDTMQGGNRQPFIKDTIKIKNATKKGYLEAEEGDSIRLQQLTKTDRRGRVQKEVTATLDTQCEQGVVVKE